MNKTYLLFVMSVLSIALILTASLRVSSAHEKKMHVTNTGKNAITYSVHIKPLFDKRCAKCHGEKSPVHMEFVKDVKKYKKQMKGPRMNTYTHLASFIIWPDSGSLMRALDDGKNTEKGRPGKMYRHLGKTDEERQKNLILFKDWIGYWTLKEWPDIKKEEINLIKISY